MGATTWNHTKRVEICRRSHVVLLFLLLLKILGWPEERSIDSNQLVRCYSLTTLSRFDSLPNFSDQTHHVSSLERYRRLSRASSVLINKPISLQFLYTRLPSAATAV
ncbi:unnamed protein product [Brassica oleracea var. botrytis]|uniref:(rape) hypothetical protein n=1 Tax=Brassica napus TaxID=3708 RepID=A0A816LRA9_BRANA|nr:unnamed protein product [Brassica napus]